MLSASMVGWVNVSNKVITATTYYIVLSPYFTPVVNLSLPKPVLFNQFMFAS
jgi:hypothetical protein